MSKPIVTDEMVEKAFCIGRAARISASSRVEADPWYTLNDGERIFMRAALEAFAADLIAAERESCAQIAEIILQKAIAASKSAATESHEVAEGLFEIAGSTAAKVAAAIRNRKDSEHG